MAAIEAGTGGQQTTSMECDDSFFEKNELYQLLQCDEEIESEELFQTRMRHAAAMIGEPSMMHSSGSEKPSHSAGTECRKGDEPDEQMCREKIESKEHMLQMPYVMTEELAAPLAMPPTDTEATASQRRAPRMAPRFDLPLDLTSSTGLFVCRPNESNPAKLSSRQVEHVISLLGRRCVDGGDKKRGSRTLMPLVRRLIGSRRVLLRHLALQDGSCARPCCAVKCSARTRDERQKDCLVMCNQAAEGTVRERAEEAKG